MTKRNKILLGAGVGIALLVGGIAVAVDDPHGDRQLAGIDLNNDGQVAMAEVNQVAGRRFAAFDVNTDGELTGAELLLMAGTDGRGPRYRSADNDRPRTDMAVASPTTQIVTGQASAAQSHQPVLPSDFDGNGAISAQEFSRGMATRYILMDANGNGIVSDAERHAARRGGGAGGDRRR